jgi:EAL domain-containing protein (putative c-di-GMP-specific phosphodiesterase class I)/DNA-binding NarL/FixJ family response regulator
MSEQNINEILVIDDSVDFRNLLIKFFESVCPGATIDVYDPADGKPSGTFPWDKYDLIILDYDLGNGESGLEWLRLYKSSSNFPPTIMLTAQGNEETVVDAFRYGAQDYLRKDGLTKGRMVESINNALKKYKEESNKASTEKLSVHVYKKEKFYLSLDEVKNKDLVTFIEIDKFQSLRDDIGMLSADKTSNFVSDEILKLVTDSEHTGEVTRIGDSSLAILIHNYQKDDKGTDICEQLCKHFYNTKFKLEGKTIDFSLSMASIYVSDEAKDADTIMKQLDIACRAARDKPGHSYVSNDTKNKDEIKIDEKLKVNVIGAFSENRVKPQYQSFVKLSDMDSKFESMEYYQVRISLIDLDGETIEAREFIPVVEYMDMQKEMDRWVISSCLKEIATTASAESGNSGFFISLTEDSLTDMTFPKWVESELNVHGASDIANSLVLEINLANYSKYEKQAAFLIKTLGEKYNILFALSEIAWSSSLEKFLTQSKFDFIMFSPFTSENKMTENDIINIVNTGKEFSCISVATKVEDNDAMMTVMSCELDLISGYFLQPPQGNIIETEVVEV